MKNLGIAVSDPSLAGRISVYTDKNNAHIEVGYRNLTDYVNLNAFEKMAMSLLGLKDKWFIISYAW